ncbi:MAG: lipopolysaccharide transport periplasmic protein LptA [Gammaproteobacteria bacterium]
MNTPGMIHLPLSMRLLLLLMALCLPATLSALPSDREQPIYIEADSVEIDDASGISIYRGNVHYIQGTTELTADEATVYSEQRKFKKLVATGDPAHYTTLPEGKQEKMTAEALTIIYLTDQEIYEFHEEAHLWHKDSEVFGAFISYDAQRNLVTAHKNEKERVKAILVPETKPQDDSEPPRD